MAFERKNNKIDPNKLSGSKKNIKPLEPKINTEIKSKKITDTPEIIFNKNHKKNDKTSTSIRIKSEAIDMLKKISKENDLSMNAIINDFLNQIYDENTKEFKIDIPKKNIEKIETIPTKISTEISTALKKESSYRNMVVGEYFSELILKAFSNN